MRMVRMVAGLVRVSAVQRLVGQGAYNRSVFQGPAPNLRVRLKRIFVGTIAVLAGAAVLALVADYAAFRVRVAANWNPYGSVIVNHYYAVAQKSGKTEFIFDPPRPQACVHALFPHAGWVPCWYLSRHADQRTDI
jgi:hypothetical protein